MDLDLSKKLADCDDLVKKLDCKQIGMVQDILHRNAKLIQEIIKIQKDATTEMRTPNQENIVTIALSIQELNANLNQVYLF